MKELIKNGLVLENAIIDCDGSTISEYRQSYYKKHGKIFSQTALASMLKLNDASVISRMERGEMGMDNRTFSVFLLLTDLHPYYKLKLKDPEHADKAELFIPAPDSVDDIAAVRHKVEGLSQRNLSILLGLHENMINKYESSSATSKNRRTPSPHTWIMLLLVTKQHPFYELKSRGSRLSA